MSSSAGGDLRLHTLTNAKSQIPCATIGFTSGFPTEDLEILAASGGRMKDRQGCHGRVRVLQLLFHAEAQCQ